ncbi:hypothetical protein [Kroppenstedtia sanguinis]|uniref:Uncharacterized protein n=1 Tax=Kroppenstedtia sanguinis TaxID=1380684 RepID=A0ABW4C526_9BACL
MIYAALLGVVIGSFVIGLPFGFVIGSMFAQLDRRRFQPPLHQGRATWGTMRKGSAGVVWSERTG